MLLAAVPVAACSTAAAAEDVFADARSYPVGDFVLQLTLFGGAPALRVHHVSEPGRAVWESYPGRGFVATGTAGTDIAENTTPASGFTITDTNLVRQENQTVDAVDSVGGAVILRGRIGDAGYTMTFSQPVAHHLRFAVTTSADRVFLRYRSDPDEQVLGFGQQLTYLDQKGRQLPILVQEHGVGRGLPIVTQAVALEAGARSAGDWYTTEVSVPHYLTTANRSLFLESSEYCVFDWRAADYVEIELNAPTMTGRILHGTDPLSLIEAYTVYSGRMRPLPDWIHEGAIIAVQGGSAIAQSTLDTVVNADIPLSAFWIQDWVGVRTTPVGQQLWWDWKLDPQQYPDWSGLVAALQARRGARVMIYINPFLANQPGHDELYQQAQQNGYLVRKADGTPVAIPSSNFSAGLIDLTNPAARTWIKGVITSQMITGAQSSGWMADFGEALPFDAVLHSGESPASFHNHYAEEWARMSREAIEEAGRGDDIVFFSRSGYTQSPGISTLFWVGDQLQSWDVHDGIRSALVGMLSGGVSGFSLVHSDTGGYDSLSAPVLGAVVHRTKELFNRWAELSAFTPVLRTHRGLDPAVAWQFDSDAETLAHFRRCVQLYRAWAPLRKQLAAEAARTGHPIMRALALHHADDEIARTIDDQYLLGPDVLVAPVLDDRATERSLYLPEGDWLHLWTAKTYFLRRGGEWVHVPAPIGNPPIFLRIDSPAGAALRTAVADAGLLR
ncbi:alpha-glucosidase [Pseudonocardia ailaonensis]|uniref:Alpha-glucosidase n=2 Tax=Pseudonocardia ailaonensis TaxID=367279 RepID=A0ABN2N6F0_9PSEU